MNNKLYSMNLSNQNTASHTKSSKPTLRFSSSPFAIREESSVLSLNIEDLQTLMKKKEKEYQNQLLIEDAKRVHNFLSEVQEQQRQTNKEAFLHNRRHLKQSVCQYNNQTLLQFQKQWKTYLSDTVKEIEYACMTADEQHDAELVKAQERVRQAQQGKGLELIKYSRAVLQLEDQLVKLVKFQRYEEAQVVSKKLQSKKKLELKQFLRSTVERQKKLMHQLKQKQNKEKEILSNKFAQIYEQQQQKRAKQVQRLVKNIRTYEVDVNKVEFKVNRVLRSNQESSRKRSNSAFEISRIKNVEIKEYQILEDKNAKQFSTQQ